MSEDETNTPEEAKDFVAEETTDIDKTEQAPLKERTRESEIQANIEFWEGLGYEVSEEDVRREIESLPEINSFDWYFYIPEGATFAELVEKARKQFPITETDGIYNKQIKMPRNSESSYAIATRYSRMPDEDSVLTDDDSHEGREKFESKRKSLKTALEWEATDYTLMSPLEVMIAELRYYKENSSANDPINSNGHLEYGTMCPGSRTSTDQTVPYFRYQGQTGYASGDWNVGLHIEGGQSNKTAWNDYGIRRVITNNTPPKILEKYRQEAEKKKE